jgi:hypothetical protein
MPLWPVFVLVREPLLVGVGDSTSPLLPLPLFVLNPKFAGFDGLIILPPGLLLLVLEALPYFPVVYMLTLPVDPVLEIMFWKGEPLAGLTWL